MKFEDDKILCPKCNKNEGKTLNVLNIEVIGDNDIVETCKCKCRHCDNEFETAFKLSCKHMDTSKIKR